MSQSNKNKHIIIIGIFIAVASGVILSFIEPRLKFITPYLRWFGQKIAFGLSLLNKNYSTPLWVLIILSFSIFILYIVTKKLLSSKPEFIQYTKDTIYGILWRWSWNDKEIVNLVPFCPHCDTELVYEEFLPSDMSIDNKMILQCERCGKKRVGSIIGYSPNSIMSTVRREIERKTRTKEYKEDST